MARSDLTVQAIARTGLEPAYAAANVDGNAFANDGQTFIHVKNGGGVEIDVTIPTPAQVDGLDVEDVVVAVPAGEERMIGPFQGRLFGQPADSNKVWVNYESVTTVTVAAIRL